MHNFHILRVVLSLFLAIFTSLPIFASMEKYMVFAGNSFYPIGGFNDFVGSYPDLEKANRVYDESLLHYDWAHVVDRDSGEILVEEKAALYEWGRTQPNGCIKK